MNKTIFTIHCVSDRQYKQLYVSVLIPKCWDRDSYQDLVTFRWQADSGQRIDFTVVDHAAQQRLSVVRNAKSPAGKARGKTREAQDTHGVFNERGRHVPQHAILQIG